MSVELGWPLASPTRGPWAGRWFSTSTRPTRSVYPIITYAAVSLTARSLAPGHSLIVVSKPQFQDEPQEAEKFKP
jgi:hypothetical protein